MVDKLSKKALSYKEYEASNIILQRNEDSKIVDCKSHVRNKERQAHS